MKNAKRIISFVLMLALMLSICASAFASGEEPYKYLAVGDSTASAYNSDEFEIYGLTGLDCGKNERIYPNLMGKYLEEELGREVEVTCLLPEGIRAHDLRAVLDPTFTGDVYCQNHIKQWSDRFGDYDQLHNTFCEAIAEADLMSIDVCMSALGNYFADRVKVAAGLKSDKSYEEFFGGDTMDAYLGGKYDLAIKTVAACRGTAQSILEGMGMPTDLISKIIDAYEYSVGSLMINFTELVKKIYELNDDIQLIVMSPFITTNYDFTFTCRGVSFSLGSLMHLYICAMYDYMVSFDPNHGRYKLADVYHTYLRCFPDAIADGEWGSYKYVTEEIRNTLLEKGLPVAADIPEQEEYFRNTVCKNIEKAFRQTEFNLESAPWDVLRELLTEGSDVLDGVVTATAADYDNASDYGRLVLKFSFVFESWGNHPDYSGHNQKFEAMRKVYEKPYTAKYSILAKAVEATCNVISALKNNKSVESIIKNELRNSSLGIITIGKLIR